MKRPKAKIPASRLKALLAFDLSCLAEATGCTHVIGVDEVGRGSMIGPVVAAAVCMPVDMDRKLRRALALLNDSKLVPAPEREALAACLKNCAHYAVAEASQQEIEQLNVSQASLLAAARAVNQMLVDLPTDTPDTGGCPPLRKPLILIDGRFILPTRLLTKKRVAQKAIVKGDSKSAAIAAASVIAKVSRDGWVCQQAPDYPTDYDWVRNMGYGTPRHIEAIRRLGATPLHRHTFLSRVYETQQTLALALVEP